MGRRVWHLTLVGVLLVGVLLVGVLLTGGCTAPSRAHVRGLPPPPTAILPPYTPDSGTEAGLSTPVRDPLYPAYGNPSLDVLRYQLNLAWTPPQRELSGTAVLTIRATVPVTEIGLDFSDAYVIDLATVDGRTVQTGRRDNDITLPAVLAKDARTTVVVSYHGRPRTVPMPSRRRDFPEGVGLRSTTDGEAWTMQEPYGAFTWYPANDQPSDEATYDIAVAVPKGWAAVTHGDLLGIDQGATSDTYRWTSREPAASYVATLAVGRYTRVTDSGPGGLPVTYWIRTGRDEPLLPALRRTPASLAWLEQHFGPYPFPSASVVVVDSLSAMETQQTVTYGAKLSRGTPPLSTVEEVLLHEFSHQWFGDAVTPAGWEGLWLNEGFAMYAEWRWTIDKGWQTDEEWVTWARRTDGELRSSAGPPGHPGATHFGESNVYAGPALMLREIHRSLGDAAFFALAADWVRSQRNRQVDRSVFITFVNQHTGRDFTTLINSWLDAPTTPAVS